MSWLEETVDGEPVVVYPVGTRVRDKRFLELVGVIERLERHESGKISPLPFFVRWDGKDRARELRGLVSWYASADTVEPGEARRIMGRREMLMMKPGEVQDGDMFAIKVIAVAGHCDDWVSYYGPTSWPDEKVAEVGEKLTREQVEKLFYVMCERSYRR